MAYLRIENLDPAGPLLGTDRVLIQRGTGVGSALRSTVDDVAAYASPEAYIDGLLMQWVSATALTVTAGAAYIEGAASIAKATADIAKSGLILSASTWYHVYLYLNAGTPDVEIVTTAPATPYAGTARSKTGDTSRRYVGSIKTDASGNIFNFQQSGHYIGYKHDHGAAPFRVLAAGVATVETTVSLAGVVPTTSRITQVYLLNLSNHLMGTGTPDDSAGGPPFAGIALIADMTRIIVLHPLDSSQQMTYWLASLGAGLTGSAYLDVYGYQYER